MNLKNKRVNKALKQILATTLVLGVGVQTFGAVGGENVSPWAKDSVVSFLGSNFSNNWNYKYPISRYEFSEYLFNYLQSVGFDFTKVTPKTLSDTQSQSMGYLAGADILTKSDLTKGYPSGKITREEMCEMLVRTARKLGTPFQKKGNFTGKDKNTFSSSYAESIHTLFSNDIMQGTSVTTFSPKVLITREQTIMTLKKFDTYVSNAKTNGNFTGQGLTSTNQQPLTTDAKNLLSTTQNYTYNPMTEELTIKQSCIIDGSVQNAVNNFKKITIQNGARVTLKNITVTDMLANRNDLDLSRCTITNLEGTDLIIKSTGDTSIADFVSYKSLNMKSPSTNVKKLTIKTLNGSSAVECDTSNLIVEGSGTLELGGNHNEVDLNNDVNFTITETGKVSNLNVIEDCDIEVKAYGNLSNLNVEAKVKFEAEKKAKLSNIKVTTDGKNSTFKVNSNVKITTKASIKVNNKTVRSSESADYDDGELKINGKNSSDRDDRDDRDDGDDYDNVKDAYNFVKNDSNLLQTNKSMSEVTSNLYLPTSKYNSKIVWTSSDDDIINKYGDVTRQSADRHVTLKAKITCGDESKTYEVEVKVLKKEETKPEVPTIDLEALGNKITIPTDIPVEIGTLVLPYNVDKATVKWTSSEPEIITELGVIKHPEHDRTIVMTAVLSYNNQTAIKFFNVLVRGTSTEEDGEVYRKEALRVLEKIYIPEAMMDELTISIPEEVQSLGMNYSIEVLDTGNLKLEDNKLKQLEVKDATEKASITICLTYKGITVTKTFDIKVLGYDLEIVKSELKDKTYSLEFTTSLDIDNFNLEVANFKENERYPIKLEGKVSPTDQRKTLYTITQLFEKDVNEVTVTLFNGGRVLTQFSEKGE